MERNHEPNGRLDHLERTFKIVSDFTLREAPSRVYKCALIFKVTTDDGFNTYPGLEMCRSHKNGWYASVWYGWNYQKIDLPDYFNDTNLNKPFSLTIQQINGHAKNGAPIYNFQVLIGNDLVFETLGNEYDRIFQGSVDVWISGRDWDNVGTGDVNNLSIFTPFEEE